MSQLGILSNIMLFIVKIISIKSNFAAINMFYPSKSMHHWDELQLVARRQCLAHLEVVIQWRTMLFPYWKIQVCS